MNLKPEQRTAISAIWNLDENDPDVVKILNSRTRYDIIEDILGYEGIIGYTSQIMRTIEILYELNFIKRVLYELDLHPSPEPSDERFR